MMLADHLIQKSGTEDLGGMITSIGGRVKQAQRFAMGRDAAEACLELLRSRPSNLVKALPLCRLPYETMWIETAGGFADNMPAREGAPIPAMQGTLIEGLGGQRGVMTVAWVHPPNANVDGYHCNASPYSLWFDFAADGDALALVREHHRQVLTKVDTGNRQWIEKILNRIETKFHLPAGVEEIRHFMRNRSFWERWANDAHEIEALRQHDRHMKVGLSPHGLGAVMAALELGVALNTPKVFSTMMTSWEGDIEGEGPFAQFFITLLNSKNCTTREPVSMTKLNKARARRGTGNKPPLLDYTMLNLTMSRARARAAAASGISRETAHQHLVMGHFKIRKTGIYWWNPFVRGDASKPGVERQRYEVEA